MKREETRGTWTRGLNGSLLDEQSDRAAKLVGSLKFQAGLVGGDREDAHGVGRTLAGTPALEGNDGGAGLEDAELQGLGEAELDAVVDVLLPLASSGAGVGEEEGVGAAVEVARANGLVVAGDDQDGARGAVLGHQAGGVTGGGHEENGTGLLFQSGGHGSHGDRLFRVRRGLDDLAHLVEECRVGDGRFGQAGGLSHGGNGLDGVEALGSLTGKHDAVSTIENGVEDVGHLSASGAVVLDHGLEHLGGADDGLASQVALRNHHLLADGHGLGGDLNTEITTSDHDAVGLLENLGEVLHALVGLDLGDDLDVAALGAENLADVLDILGSPNEGGKDVVEVFLDGELDVSLVLGRQGGEVNVGHGEVDTLLVGEDAGVDGADLDGRGGLDRNHVEGENAVVDVDLLADVDLLGQVLVVDVEVGGAGLLGVGVVGRNVELVAGVDGGVLAIDHEAGAHLRALGVERDGQRTTGVFGLDLAGVVDDRLEVLVGAVGGIQTDDVHAGVAEGLERRDIVALGADGADDRGLAGVGVGVGLLEGEGVQVGDPLDLGHAGVGSKGHDVRRREVREVERAGENGPGEAG